MSTGTTGRQSGHSGWTGSALPSQSGNFHTTKRQ